MAEDKGDIAGQAPDVEDYAHRLYLSDLLRGRAVLAAIRALRLPSGSWGLDAGCGIGSHTLLLAKEVASAGHVTGLDLSPAFLALAGEKAKRAGMAKYVSFREGDVRSLPFADDSFDWAWSADCVGYMPAGPLPLLKELARVVKPGGIIAILAWSSQQLLPGYPLLEAKLNATAQGLAPFAAGRAPESHFLRALGWFRDADLEEPSARTFVGEIHAPLSDDMRSALISFLDMRWGEPGPELSRDDRAEYRRLSRPESEDFILDLPGYYAFFTYSMFSGRVAR
ncbi:class I SAM-dependent methyltransferase [Chloroflexota bacterium]